MRGTACDWGSYQRSLPHAGPRRTRRSRPRSFTGWKVRERFPGEEYLAARISLDREFSLYRLTREDGHVTLPITIVGPANALTVNVDVGKLLQRAIINRAEDELQKAIDKALGGLIKKPK
jgi:hypothetical protein